MVDYNRLCMRCMKEKQSTELICPHCGYDPAKRVPKPNCLPSPSILKGRYLTGEPLGIGGFGITYIAFDLQVGVVCAIKEYMPDTVASRDGESVRITLSEQKQELFDYGLKRFIEESGMLASFCDEPNIIHVYDRFEENHTAYYVMEYLDGSDLKSLTRNFTRKLDSETGLPIMLQVMNGLEALHRRQVIHRDISPDNIYITRDNRVKLLDFGSARYSFNQRNRNLSIIIKVGYAPHEQYSSVVEQGPWTDIYALAATFYHVFTGSIPPESTERLLRDTLRPVQELNGAVSGPVSAVLMKALALNTQDRYQSTREMREELLPHSKRQEAAPVSRIREAPPRSVPASPPPRIPDKNKTEDTGKSADAAFFRKRAAAYLIDMALYAFAVGIFLMFVLQFIQQQGMLTDVAMPVVLGTLLFAPVLMVLINTLLECSEGGGTAGKRIMGLKAVSLSGGTLEFSMAIKRNLIKLLSVFLLITEKDQTYLHERISNSKVIDKR